MPKAAAELTLAWTSPLDLGQGSRREATPSECRQLQRPRRGNTAGSRLLGGHIALLHPALALLPQPPAKGGKERVTEGPPRSKSHTHSHSYELERCPAFSPANPRVQEQPINTFMNIFLWPSVSHRPH